jgi:hypothetical protein
VHFFPALMRWLQPIEAQSAINAPGTCFRAGRQCPTEYADASMPQLWPTGPEMAKMNLV